jgi:hypothetical protein
MNKYRVYFTKSGYVDVIAEDETEAEIIAFGEEVNCEDGWEMVDETKIILEDRNENL